MVDWKSVAKHWWRQARFLNRVLNAEIHRRQQEEEFRQNILDAVQRRQQAKAGRRQGRGGKRG